MQKATGRRASAEREKDMIQYAHGCTPSSKHPGQCAECGEPLELECNCWVSGVADEIAFGLRYGAHSLSCPRYRRSGDPVDNAYDNDLRRHGEVGKIT
mgnify:CR=1 FL=1